VQAGVNTIDLGSANNGSDTTIMTQAGTTFFPAGIKGDYGITVSRIANTTANVAVIETSNADIRGLFSVSAGSQGYNSGTGVISVPSTSDHITEGTNLFYTVGIFNAFYMDELLEYDKEHNLDCELHGIPCPCHNHEQQLNHNVY